MHLFKRIAAIAGLIALVIVPFVATAHSPAQLWADQDVIIRHIEQSATGRIVWRDSLTSRQLAYAGGTVDTTDMFDTQNLHYRGPHLGWHVTNGLITDTTKAFVFTAATVSGEAVTGLDSLIITIQVSGDRGASWASVDSIGQANTILLDLSSVGNASMILSTTSIGLGTGRINWDRPACDYIRFLIRKDPNGGGAPVKFFLTTRQTANQ